MTVREQLVDVYESLGELDQLNIYGSDGVTVDLSTAGSTKILSALNSSQYAIATWRDDAKMRALRLRTFYQEQYGQVTVSEGECPSAGTTSTVALAAADQGQVDNYYQGWVVKTGDESRLVVASDGTTVTVGRVWSTAPASGDTYLLTRRWLDVTMTGGVEDVLRVTDLTADVELDRGEQADYFRSTMAEVGDPSAWFRSGTRLYLDRAPDSTRYFLMQLYRLPTTMTALTDESELPVQFHRGMVLWVLGYWGFAREFEPAMAYSFQRKFNDFMKETMSEYEVTSWRDGGPEVYVEAT